MQWLAFTYSLPSGKKSSARVTLWRRLQRLGAVAPAGNIYFLPHADETHEAFMWLVQETQQSGGQAILLTVEQLAGVDDDALIDLFCTMRNEAYAPLLAEARQLEAAIAKQHEQRDTHVEQLKKLRSQHSEQQRIDYFNCAKGKEMQQKLQQLEGVLVDNGGETAVITPRDPTQFKDKTWVTRPKPHVDRLATIWLLSRFVDNKAQFLFTNAPPDAAVTFDMPNADFGHTGSLCTFETVKAAFAIQQAGLQTVAEIVHEIDLNDGRYFHPEAAGLASVLDGWRDSEMSDEELVTHGLRLFDGLLTNIQKRGGR